MKSPEPSFLPRHMNWNGLSDEQILLQQHRLYQLGQSLHLGMKQDHHHKHQHYIQQFHLECMFKPRKVNIRKRHKKQFTVGSLFITDNVTALYAFYRQLCAAQYNYSV